METNVPWKFLTPEQYRTEDWTIYDDIQFFEEHPELFPVLEAAK